MSLVADLTMYGRFAWGLPGFLRRRISLTEARAIVQRRMAEREANFIRLLERGIFGYPRSPYLPLLTLAGCELGDIRHMVRTRGLENTLRALREAGVYVSFEEFKGRQPIVRNERVIQVQARDFDNPYLSHCYQAESGGSTGAGTRVSIDLEHVAAETPFHMLALDAHGVLDIPTVLWRGTPPDNSGIYYLLHGALMGRIPQKWFSPLTGGGLRPPLTFRLATEYIVRMGRLLGVPIPWPEPVPLAQAAVVARWVTEILKAHHACLICCVASTAVRVSVAAQEEGLDLTGATFQVGGEPPTPAKVERITRIGARCHPVYHFAEVGRVGMGCARPASSNDVHFFKDGLAAIQHPRRVPGSEITVEAFCFTTLLPTAPTLMLNVESDDYGVLETRSCGCALERYGYTDHVRDIESFGKLTGEGITLVGSEMVRILEEVLPARFGGSPLDYQLWEEEDEQSLTRLSLLVSPKITIPDERAVIDAVLEAMRQSSLAGDVARAIWSQAGTLRVRRLDPIPTGRGKLMPLHIVRRADRSIPT